MEPGKNRGIVVLVVLICHFACSAKNVHAQPAAGPPAGLEHLKPGQLLMITDSNGETKGRFVGFVGDQLVLRTPAERRFPAGTISKVKQTDSVWTGAVIGSLVLGVACAVICGQGLDGHQPLLPVVLVNAGFGAAIGLAMDALSSGTTLYRQHAPAATAGGHRTVAVSFSRRF